MFIASISNSLKIHDYEKCVLQFSYGNSKELYKNTTWSEDGKYILLVCVSPYL